MKMRESSRDAFAAGGVKGTDYVKLACAYIEKNYMNDITVGDISAHVAIERSYLYRLFLKEKGISPSKYLQTVRLKRTKEMLEEGKLSLGEIPALAGFKNRSRFAVMFKRTYGVSPAERESGKQKEGE